MNEKTKDDNLMFTIKALKARTRREYTSACMLYFACGVIVICNFLLTISPWSINVILLLAASMVIVITILEAAAASMANARDCEALLSEARKYTDKF